MTPDPHLYSRAEDLVAHNLVWDNHACMPLRPHDTSFLPQLERCRRAGVNVVSLNVGFGQHGVEEHIRMLAALREWLASRPGEYVLAHSVADIRRARADRRLAVCFDIEGMCAVADQPSLVRLYYDLGVRWMLVAYNSNNAAGGGCQDADSGLTDFGRKVLDRMAEIGMVACCSHTGYRTAREAIEHSAKPVIFSHSNPRALCDHPRNIPDELMRACADKGGVIAVNGVGVFLGDPEARAESVARHVDYALQAAGEDHVGLALDYVFDASELDDYMEALQDTFPSGLGYGRGMRIAGPESFTPIAAELLRLGHGAATIRKVLGENHLRIAREVWK